MSRRPRAWAVVAALVAGVASARAARAEDPPRPKEDDLFAAPASAPPVEDPTRAAADDEPQVPASGDARDAALLGDGERAPPSDGVAPEDPLRLGGQAYLRATASGARGQTPDDWAFGSPSLLDAYLDARPNDRVRAFVVARMSYDPTLPDTAYFRGYSADTLPSTGGAMGSAPLESLFATRTREPQVLLDQLWLRFDVARRLFVTAGKQHVRWGTARLWTPTDFLHVRRRNPLDVFDARTGTTMLKLHLPVESLGWNFYSYAVMEQPGPTSTLGALAGAARAELVLGTSELGLGAHARRGQKPKFAFDVSTGVGDFDLHGELALRYGSEIDRVGYDPNAAIPAAVAKPDWQAQSDHDRRRLEQIVDALYPVHRSVGVKPQAVGGATYARKYNDNDVFTIGAEYFFNALGYPSPRAYPGLVFPHTFALAEPATFFYLGRHYAAVFVSLPAPFSLDLHTFTLSTLGNLSDSSFITRLDYGYTLLTHLRLELFASARYGSREGEFRFGVANLDLGGTRISRAPALVDVGAALRMEF